MHYIMHEKRSTSNTLRNALACASFFMLHHLITPNFFPTLMKAAIALSR